MSVMKEIELLLKISWFTECSKTCNGFILIFHYSGVKLWRLILTEMSSSCVKVPFTSSLIYIRIRYFILCRPIRKTIQSLVGWYVVFSTKHSIKDLLWLVTSHTSGTNRWWRLLSRIFKCRGINKRWRVWDITSLVQIFVFHIIYW